ncbi:MAG: HAD family hydrolase [Candidatus Nanohaloarchaea archaeon]
MSYEGVIFDFDGVLLDAAFDDWKWAEKARREKARELGYEIDGNGRHGFLFQTDSLDEMKQMVEENGFTWHDYIEVEKAAAARKAEMVRNGEMGLFPDARQVLREIEVPKAVVSNAFGATLEDIVLQLGIDDHLEFWAAPRLSEIEKYHEMMKPETHMLEDALEVLGTRNAVMIGDSDFDIRAAKNAGIDSVLIDRGKAVDVEPDHVVDSLEEFSRLVREG